MLADWELWIRLASTAKIAACEAVHVAYVLHDENMNVTDPDPRREFDLLADLHMPNPARRREALITGARWRAYNHRRVGRRGHAAREYAHAALAYRSPGMAVRAGGALLAGRSMSRKPRPSDESVAPWLDNYRGIAAATRKRT
jgi:hypothetical protein